MIKVVAKGYVKAGEVDKFKEVASGLVEESRKEEENISYGLYQDASNEQILTFIEEWKDQAALDKHMKTSHFVNAMGELSKLQEKDMDINIYNLAI
ncbi:MAG: putative quinol monooxygenase [Clostridium sp.]|uniref:putative quinol monooxygenase n=1 Tax=Clostridium sp. TaxID=1506 RepID=UPI0039E8DA27